MVRYVAGDIGGTNTRLNLMEIRDRADEKKDITDSVSSDDEFLVAEEVYPSQAYSSLTFLIQKFLSTYVTDSDHPSFCCLVVAGPVAANRSHLTNVNWTIDGDQMAKELKMNAVRILNDFVGIGYGLLGITRCHVVPLNDCPAVAESPKACIGAGTGLGEAYLTWNGREYDVSASEGGHCDFAPRDDKEFGLLKYLMDSEMAPRISVERVVSGTGIPRIYDFLASQHPDEVKDEVTARLRVEDKGKVIAMEAQNGRCNLCVQAITQFVKSYGAEAGNLALKTLPFGGLYVAGGIAPKLLWALQKNHEFWHNFINKGRMRSLLERVPIYVVTHPNPGLLGAKIVCRRMLREEGFQIRGEVIAFSHDRNQFNIKALMERSDLEHEVRGDTSGSAPVERIVVRKRKQTTIPYDGNRMMRDGGLEPRSESSRSLSSFVLIGSAIAGGLVASITTLGLTAMLLKIYSARTPPSNRNT